MSCTEETLLHFAVLDRVILDPLARKHHDMDALYRENQALKKEIARLRGLLDE